MELRSPTLQVDSLPSEPPGKPSFFLGAFLISLFSVATESGDSLGPGDTSVYGVGSSQVG